jgi:WXG100 family type VII secretion target
MTPDGHFLVQKAVGGRVLWGSDTQDGGFISEDGKTYVDSSGKVEHGISTPDGQFIPNGTTHIMPDGSTAYGTMAGKDFFSADGHTIVLDNGTILHGNDDWATGIFTTNSGDAYFVGQNGVTHGHFRPADGALVLDGDGGVVMTPGSWKVDLAQIADALALINNKSDSISKHQDTIMWQCQSVKNSWRSPAGDTFASASDKVQTALSDLCELVDNVAERMQQSYDNYRNSERANVKNVSHS